MWIIEQKVRWKRCSLKQQMKMKLLHIFLEWTLILALLFEIDIPFIPL